MKLSDYTPARVGLGITGESLPTKALLDFRLAHARARDAVHIPLDTSALAADLDTLNIFSVRLHSAAANRGDYLRNPDKGRSLDRRSAEALADLQQNTAVIIADGLSGLAVNRHAAPLLKALALPKSAPVLIVEQARVAIGDPIGQILKSELSIVLIGERPGLSTPDSLGIYITWSPRVGRTDAERNCISNIHDHGLSYAEAARRVSFLTNEARQRKLTGVQLKENSGGLIGV